MKYKSALFWGGLIAAAGIVTFQTSYEVQELEEKLGSLNRKIMAEQEAIQILKAEWSYLNDPTRLENLSRQHLALQPTEARQFVAMDVVPLRPAPVPEAAPAPVVPGKGNNGPAPLPPMASNSVKPAVNGGAVNGGAIIPASTAAPAKPAPIKPAAIIPAAAKAPALPPAAPAAAPVMAKPAPILTTKPTDIAARPPAPPKALTPPVAKQPQSASNNAAPPPPTAPDSIGVLVARLGANR